MPFYDVEHVQDANCSNIVVFKLEISRTYDDVVDYVIRELELRLVYGNQGTKFPGVEYFRIRMKHK